MMKVPKTNSDSFDTLRSPIIPALLFMTLTSLPPTNTTFSLNRAASGTCQGILGGANATWDSLTLFLEDAERYTRRLHPVRTIAQEKGVNLPEETSCLPDETVKILASQSISPDFINPSQEDSLIIEFTADNKYYMVEFYNDGEIILLVRDNNGRDIWELDSTTYLKKLNQELAPELEASLID